MKVFRLHGPYGQDLFMVAFFTYPLDFRISLSISLVIQTSLSMTLFLPHGSHCPLQMEQISSQLGKSVICLSAIIE